MKNVPLLISRLARVCINEMVSIEKLAKEYELTKHERAELEQLVIDKKDLPWFKETNV